MPNLHTNLYHLDIRGFDYQIAHLYEHLLVKTFLAGLSKRGLSPYLSGWASGQTFDDIMFIEGAFYSAPAAELFDKHMKSHRRFDPNLINTELECLQAETGSVITKLDKNALMAELSRLDQAEFTNHEDLEFSDYLPMNNREDNAAIIHLNPNQADFADVTVQFAASNLTMAEKLAFLRVTPLIRTVVDIVMSGVGGYKRAGGIAVDNPGDTLMSLDIYTIKNTLLQDDLETKLAQELAKLKADIAAHPTELKHYAEVFCHEARWADFPAEYYGQTGIVATRRAIASALTPGNVDALLGKLQFKVSPTTDDHWRQT